MTACSSKVLVSAALNGCANDAAYSWRRQFPAITAVKVRIERIPGTAKVTVLADHHATFFEPVAGLDPKRLATRRLVQYVQKHVFTQTCVTLARQVGIDEKPIRQIFADHVADLEVRIRFATPRWLASTN